MQNISIKKLENVISKKSPSEGLFIFIYIFIYPYNSDSSEDTSGTSGKVSCFIV